MSDADVSAAARELSRARWGDRVLARSAATVLERADVTEGTRHELELIAGIPAPDGDER